MHNNNNNNLQSELKMPKLADVSKTETLVRERVYDPLFLLLSCEEVYDGNCLIESMKLQVKLKKIGAKRVRGKRNIDREWEEKMEEKKLLHYWVECGDLIYENYCGMSYIYHKKSYYRDFKMSDIEYAIYDNLLFKDDMKYLSLYGEMEAFDFIDLYEKILFPKGYSISKNSKKAKIYFENILKDTGKSNEYFTKMTPFEFLSFIRKFKKLN